MPTAQPLYSAIQQAADVLVNGAQVNSPLLFYPDDGTFRATRPEDARDALGIATPVMIHERATSGDGSQGSPWSGWMTGLTLVSYGRYFFKAGYYNLPSTLTLQTLNGVMLEGEAERTHLVWSGGATPMIFVDESAGDYGTFHNRIRGFVFDANATATGIIRLRSAHKNTLSDLRWKNFPASGTTYGIKCESLVTPRIENCSALNEHPTDPDANCPTYHLWLTHRSDHPEWTNTIPIIDNCWFKGAKSHGIFVEYAISPVIIGGASERAGLGGAGYGIYINASVESGEIHGTDVEACAYGGFYVGGNAWTLTSTTTFGTGCNVVIAGNMNTLIGGFTQERVVISGNYNRLINFGMRSDLPAPNDSGTGNTWSGNTYNQTSTLDVPTQRAPVITGNATVLPGDMAGYFGVGGHTLTLDWSTSAWTGKSVDIINYSAASITVAVTAGGLIVSGVGTEASSQTLPAKTACRITRDSSYWVMRTFGIGSGSTSGITEGSNLYYTDERVDDRVAALVQSSSGSYITWSYNDGSNTLTPVIGNLAKTDAANSFSANQTLGSAIQLLWSTDTGLARNTAGVVRVTNGSTGIGTIKFGGAQVTDLSNTKIDINFTNIGITMRSGDPLNWSSSAVNADTAADTGFARNAAGVVKVTNGSTGDGAIAASSFYVGGTAGPRFVNSSGTIRARNNADSAYVEIEMDGIRMKNGADGFWSSGNGSIGLKSGSMVGWSSSSSNATVAADVAIVRNAAGIIEINSGTAGTLRDLACRNITTSGDVRSVSGYGKSGTALTQGLAFSGSTSQVVGGGNGALVELTDNSGHTYLSLSTATCTFLDAMNLVFGTSTGTKIGTATGQKLGFWNATPVVQQVLATGAGRTVDDVITLLQTLGLCRQA